DQLKIDPVSGLPGTLGVMFRNPATTTKLSIEANDSQQRHGTEGINIIFADGHGATATGEDAWNEVNISPYIN
ncbi:MAG: hypothetical protein AAF663_08065, partial [Planctomycetota bacterium]